MQIPKKFDMDTFVKGLVNFRSLHLGLTGSGKTVLIRRFISRLNSIKKWNVFCLDVKPEMKMKKVGWDMLSQQTFVRRVHDISIDGVSIQTPTLVAEFVAACAWAFHPAVAYFEEMAEAIDKDSVNFAAKHPNVYKCLQQGRSEGVSVIASTQMITQTNLTFFRQASHIFLHWMKPSECRWVEQSMGLDENSLEFEPFDENNPEDPKLHRFYLFKAPASLVYYEALPWKKNQKDEELESEFYEEEKKIE